MFVDVESDWAELREREYTAFRVRSFEARIAGRCSSRAKIPLPRRAMLITMVGICSVAGYMRLLRECMG